jgi:outer membrane protein OmpA-like peptidoglycan-associated protein
MVNQPQPICLAQIRRGLAFTGLAVALAACVPPPAPRLAIVYAAPSPTNEQRTQAELVARIERYRSLTTDDGSRNATVNVIKAMPDGSRPGTPPETVIRFAFDQGTIFAPGAFNPRKDARTLLMRIAQNLVDDKAAVTLTIVGYSDIKGSKKLNDDIALAQVLKLMQRLQELGVAPDRIRVVGLGRAVRSSGDDNSGAAPEVEFYVSRDPQANIAALALSDVGPALEIGPCTYADGKYDCIVLGQRQTIGIAPTTALASQPSAARRTGVRPQRH